MMHGLANVTFFFICKYQGALLNTNKIINKLCKYGTVLSPYVFMFYESPRRWGMYHSFVKIPDSLLLLYLFTVIAAITLQYIPTLP